MKRDIMQTLRGAVVGERWLPPERRRANHDCYARHLLYGDPEGRFSILSLVWDHGQQSPIHSHHTWCAIGVYDGELTELHYKEEADGRMSEVGAARRGCGSVSFEPALSSIHRITNRSDRLAISLHVYGVGADRVTTDINRLYPTAG